MWISKRKYNVMLDLLAELSKKIEAHETTMKWQTEKIFQLMVDKQDLERRLRFFGIEIGLPPDPEKDKLDFPKVTKI